MLAIGSGTCRATSLPDKSAITVLALDKARSALRPCPSLRAAIFESRRLRRDADFRLSKGIANRVTFSRLSPMNSNPR
jgi:hypothetical protein